MSTTFVRCESYGCKNITIDTYKNLYGSFCFEHTSKIHIPRSYKVSEKLLSPVSPRRMVASKSASRTRSPTMNFELENYYVETKKVAPLKSPIPSPRRNLSYVRKTECCYCKDPYDENKTMKCGHLICPQCLEGIVRSPYCEFCGEILEGPFATEEVMQKINTKYKEDLENEVNLYTDNLEGEQEEEEEEEAEEERENSYENEYEAENEEEQNYEVENELIE